MAQTDGVLRAYHEVHCTKCETPVLGLSQSKRDAARELTQHYGWERVAGLWHCAACAPWAKAAADAPAMFLRKPLSPSLKEQERT